MTTRKRGISVACVSLHTSLLTFTTTDSPFLPPETQLHAWYHKHIITGAKMFSCFPADPPSISKMSTTEARQGVLLDFPCGPAKFFAFEGRSFLGVSSLFGATSQLRATVICNCNWKQVMAKCAMPFRPEHNDYVTVSRDDSRPGAEYANLWLKVRVEMITRTTDWCALKLVLGLR